MSDKPAPTGRRWPRRFAYFFLWVLILATATAAVGWYRGRPNRQLTPSGHRQSTSQYVAMRDGTRIAVDIRIPPDLAAGQRVPVAFRASRYLRGIELGPLGRIAKGLGILFPGNPEVTAINAAGIAIVVAEVRGTGASSGTRRSELSVVEIDDLVEVLDWITGQAWSNGKVLLFGMSYDGNVAELLAARKHPSVKALVPTFSPFDLYEQPMRPGGLLNLALLEPWSQLAQAADSGRAFLGEGWKGRIQRWIVRGPKPVDEDYDGRLLAQALKGHETGNVLDITRSFVFRDDITTNGITLAPSSPMAQAATLNHLNLPTLVHGSWLDSDYGAAAIQRFQMVSNPMVVVLGAWNHGGNRNADPYAQANKPASPSPRERTAEFIAFMKSCLFEAAPLHAKREIRYVTLGEGTWHSTSRWPPEGFAPRRWYFHDANLLKDSPPTAESASDDHAVDFEVKSAPITRWHQLSSSVMAYSNRVEIDRRLLTYTSDPLDQSIEMTGSAILRFHVASTATDGAFHAYLEDVAPDGRLTYLTEGLLRALHRKVVSGGASDTSGSIRHSFLRADGAALTPGEPTLIEFEFLPTSVVFHKGHRIRLALAGADSGSFERVPAEGPVRWKVFRDALHPSSLELPVRMVPTPSPPTRSN